MRVLVTGSQGYIGSVMTPFLAAAGHDVVGLDVGFFQECVLPGTQQATAAAPLIKKDLRDLSVQDLRGFDAVVHLGALSNDPIGNLRPDWTTDINLRASVQLASLARDAGVRRYLFSSSCIMYGNASAGIVNEESPLDPQTLYASSKVEGERQVSQLASPGFSPVFLRNGTVYGPSPRMRFDTVLNDFVGQAMAFDRITVFSDGTPWRPVVHVTDVCNAFQRVLEAPSETVHNQAFNVGAGHLNIQIRDLASVVTRVVPNTAVEILSKPGTDQRTYITDFEKFERTFPDVRFRAHETGARDLYAFLQRSGFSVAQFQDPKFTRLKWLQRLLDSGDLDTALRWSSSEPVLERE